MNKKIFSDGQNRLSMVCQALGSPARIAIIEHIAARENCVEKEVIEVMDLATTTVRNHLKALKRSGLIKGNVTSKKKLSYCIDWNTMDDFKFLSNTLHKKVKQHQKLVEENKGSCL